MIFFNYIVFILIILLIHLIALSIKFLNGGKYFFGVYINKIIIESDLKDKINKDFKKKLDIDLILSIMIYLLLMNIFNLSIGANIIITITVYLTLFYLILRFEYIEVSNIKNTYLLNVNNKDEKLVSTIRVGEDEILSENKKKIIKKFKILFSICVVLSIISFIYVIISYKNMPEMIITRWGTEGKPVGYCDKNIVNVFYASFIELFIVILFSIMGLGSISGNTYIDDSNLELNRKKAIKYLNGLGYSFLALTFMIQIIMIIIPISMIREKNIPIGLMLGGCIVPIFISVILIYYYLMLTSLKPKNRNIYTIENDDENWIYGFIYYNKADPKFMVEKRLGAGWNINMAHPLGKIVTIMMVVVTVCSLLIGFI